MLSRNPNIKRVRSPNAGVADRSPDVQARLMNAVLQVAENPSTGTRYPLFSIHPDMPVVVEAAIVTLSSLTNLTSIGLGATEIGYFDYVFMRDYSGVITQPQTRWLNHTAEAKSAAGTSFAYLAELANDVYYFGMSDKKFTGLRFDVDTAGVAGGNVVVDAEYWNGSAWTDLTESDGTISSSKHMLQDGDCTFTLPSDWVAVALRDTFATTASEYSELTPSSGEGIGGCASEFNKSAYWVRLKITTTAYSTVPTLKSVKRLSDIVARVVAAAAASGMTANEPYELTINTAHKGRTGYDNQDGVPVGGACGAFVYANLIGTNTVTATIAVGMVAREDLSVSSDRTYGAKPASQPLKDMNWR